MIRCDESICYKLKISQMDFFFFFLSVSHPREDELTIKEIPSVEDILVVFKLILKNSLLQTLNFRVRITILETSSLREQCAPPNGPFSHHIKFTSF